jgi:GxxExxY protein
LVDLAKKGLKVESKVEHRVKYEGAIVGTFEPDLIVDNKVIVEIKAVEALAKPHFAQTLNYLKITNLDVALVVNFGTSRVEYRRFDNRFNNPKMKNLNDLMKNQRY